MYHDAVADDCKNFHTYTNHILFITLNCRTLQKFDGDIYKPMKHFFGISFELFCIWKQFKPF